MNNTVPLCSTCSNRDVDHILRGDDYTPELVCIYSHANYPRMHACTEYEPVEPGELDQECF